MDQVTRMLNEKSNRPLPIPLEYVKSCPFPWSFLDNYLHKTRLRGQAKEDSALVSLLKKNRGSWLNLEDINTYKPLIPKRGNKTPNAKLRQLLEITLANGGWKYLSVPPCSLPYYKPEGAILIAWILPKPLFFHPGSWCRGWSPPLFHTKRSGWP